MRALPYALSIDAAAQAQALELLERAMELALADALPPALAAWCHGQRGGHHFTTRPAIEKQAARELAARAARLKCRRCRGRSPGRRSLHARARSDAGCASLSSERWRSTAHASGRGTAAAGVSVYHGNSAEAN
jgi:hypothetical protein